MPWSSPLLPAFNIFSSKLHDSGDNYLDTRRPASWLACWTYFVVSIVDHGGAITSTLVVGMPATFQQMFDLPNDAMLRGIMMGPGGQTLIDLVCLVLLMAYRSCFSAGGSISKGREI